MSTGIPPKITILLADDHPLARVGIRNLLAEATDLEIVGEAEDGFQAQKIVAELRPNILLLDLKMPGPRPAELEKWVRENYPETVTLVLTSHDRDIYLADMMEAGVSGYMSKEVSSERLVSMIRRAVNGEILFDQKQINRAREWRKEVGDKIEQLTNQERVVLILLTQGMDNQAIAARLSIVKKTLPFI
jgi:DNA-binding NarL/FixJ family response regulator